MAWLTENVDFFVLIVYTKTQRHRARYGIKKKRKKKESWGMDYNNVYEQEIDLKDLIFAVLHRWRMILAAAVAL